MDAQRDIYIDLEDGLKRVAGNTALFKRLLGIFAAEDHFAKISGELNAGDFQSAARSAHAIKGVSANLSLTAVHAISAELESKIKNNQDYSECLEKLKSALANTLDVISDI